MDKEVYAIGLNSLKNVILHGGGDDKCTAIDVSTGDIVVVVEDFNDSVIFNEFIDEERFIVGSLDGTISLMTFEEEINNVSVNEDISKIKVNGDKLLIGTIGGTIHLFSLDLSVQNVCIGQYNEINDLCYENGKVYTLSDTNFMIFDVDTHQVLMDQGVRGGSAIDKIPASDVVCMGVEDSVIIRKNASFMNKIETKGNPECILYMNNYFIVGGDFDYILLINMPMNMRTFNIHIGISGVSIIKGDGANFIAFGTCGGYVGCGDIRDEKTFRIFEGGVGSVFDLCFHDEVIYVGGEGGFNVLDLKSISIADDVNHE